MYATLRRLRWGPVSRMSLGAVALLQVRVARREQRGAQLGRLELAVHDLAHHLEPRRRHAAEKPPELNASIVGTKLEICWRYWRTPTAEEVAGGEKRKKIGIPIWCTCTVTHLANGTTTTTNPDNVGCRALADAGAVRIRWPEDLDREVPEPESFS